MKVMNPQEEKILEELLRLAGGSGVLEIALRRAREEKGDSATIDDVIRHIAEARAELEPA